MSNILIICSNKEDVVKFKYNNSFTYQIITRNFETTINTDYPFNDTIQIIYYRHSFQPMGQRFNFILADIKCKEAKDWEEYKQIFLDPCLVGVLGVIYCDFSNNLIGDKNGQT